MSDTLLSKSHVIEQLRERRKLVEQRRLIDLQIADKDSWLNSAERLVGRDAVYAGVPPDLIPPNESMPRVVTLGGHIPAGYIPPGDKVPTKQKLPRGHWQRVLPALINRAGEGLTLAQIRERLADDPAMEGLEWSHHAVEVSVYKLVKDNFLKRRGLLLYTPSLLKKLGPIPDDASSRVGVITKAILDLDGLKRGLTSAEIMAELRKDPPMNERLGKKGNQVYNALARLLEQKALEKDDRGAYRIAGSKHDAKRILGDLF